MSEMNIKKDDSLKLKLPDHSRIKEMEMGYEPIY